MDNCFFLGPKPKSTWSVREFLVHQRERKQFWHQRFERAGILGVGPRAFYEKFGEAFLCGEASAIQKWQNEERPLLAKIHEVLMSKVAGAEDRFCGYEPAAGPGEVTVQEMPTFLSAGGEWFASDFDKLPIKMNKDRIRDMQPQDQDWIWRISRVNVAYFQRWTEHYLPRPQLKNPIKGAIICRTCKHLDDETFEAFLLQVGKTMDVALLVEAVREGFENHGIKIGVDREEKPGTKYRYLEEHTKLLGMKLGATRECMNFGDPYFFGMFTR